MTDRLGRICAVIALSVLLGSSSIVTAYNDIHYRRWAQPEPHRYISNVDDLYRRSAAAYSGLYDSFDGIYARDADPYVDVEEAALWHFLATRSASLDDAFDDELDLFLRSLRVNVDKPLPLTPQESDQLSHSGLAAQGRRFPSLTPPPQENPTSNHRPPPPGSALEPGVGAGYQPRTHNPTPPQSNQLSSERPPPPGSALEPGEAVGHQPQTPSAHGGSSEPALGHGFNFGFRERR
ncbi:hypothetical protein MMC10_003685 [Thelotrema lepadinum]|nr:hypothetical protein [Thelotrema lepadinum]